MCHEIAAPSGAQQHWFNLELGWIFAITNELDILPKESVVCSNFSV